MKEKAKLLKVGSKRKSHQVTTLMNNFNDKKEEMKIDEGANLMRRNPGPSKES
jgi:hypothetical protein